MIRFSQSTAATVAESKRSDKPIPKVTRQTAHKPAIESSSVSAVAPQDNPPAEGVPLSPPAPPEEAAVSLAPLLELTADLPPQKTPRRSSKMAGIKAPRTGNAATNSAALQLSLEA